jgi:hypothetical protein
MRRLRSILAPSFRRGILVLLPLVVAILPDPAAAQADLIPLDSAVRTGTLPNGLRYYVRGTRVLRSASNSAS